MRSAAGDPRGVALVTGASRGIGKASAVALATVGFDVAVTARTLVDGTATLDDGVTPVPGGLDTTVDAIEAAGRRGLAVAMDVLDRGSVLAAADRALDHFGRIDVLVNNAIHQGPGAMVPVAELTDGQIHDLFEGNVHAPLALIRHLLPSFIDQGGGTVINMISATAYQTPPGPIGEGGWGVAYAMTKAALERVAPLLMVEHGADRVVAHNVDPGYVVTERQRARSSSAQFATHFPSAPAEAIGAVVAWLATDPAAASEHAGTIVMAQRECKKRGLLPGWPPE